MTNISAITRKGRFSIIIPLFNHELQIAGVIEKSLRYKFPVFVIDDGSTDSSPEIIGKIKGITVLTHEKNRGKGAAIRTGFAAASKVSDWAVTIDADGQHDPDDIIKLIDAIPEKGRPVIIGYRQGMEGSDVPRKSSFGREFSNFWVRASGGPAVSDTQSGMRLYPLPEAMNLNVRADRFQFEVEILVKAGWSGIPVIETPVSVNYKPSGRRVSHFRPVVDSLRNSNTFTRLIAQRIFIPSFIRARAGLQKPQGMH